MPRTNLNMPSVLEREIIKFRSLQSTKEEFLLFLKEEKERLKSIIETVNAEKIPNEIQDEMQNEIDTGKLGIETMISALDYLQNIKSLDETALSSALKMAERGRTLIVKAAEMNVASYEAMLETMKELCESSQDPLTQGMISPY